MVVCRPIPALPVAFIAEQVVAWRIAHCDNSAADFANPNATKRVQWGELTWEEMMTGTIDDVVLK